jgi:predicted nucleic acid-binding protein
LHAGIRVEGMQFVVDANVLFSALIKDSVTLEFLFYDSAQFFAPEFILEEFYEHRTEILEKTKRTPEEFDSMFGYLEERIIVVPRDEYRDMLKQAEQISPDVDDIPYLALALKLAAPIWSNDRDLKEMQDMVKVYSTKDIIRGVKL